MATDNIKETGKYCYNIVLDAINYTSDVRNWSPNNIRRLIISPEGIAVQLHTSTRLIQKQFLPNSYYPCIVDAKYKPMVSALVNRVCSSVEEVIYCTASASGSYLPENELDLRSILATNKVYNNDAELIALIAKRFPRMRGIIICNTTISAFLNSFGVKLGDGLYQCSDDQAIASVSRVISINKDTWYKGHFLRPRDYQLDNSGGPLDRRFTNVMTTIEANKRQAEIADARAKRIPAELLSEVDKYKVQLERITTCCLDFATLMLKYEQNTMYNGVVSQSSLLDALKIPRRIVITEDIKLGDFEKKLNRLGVEVVMNKTDDSKAVITEVGRVFKDLHSQIYLSLCTWFLDTLVAVSVKYPVSARVFFDSIERRIFIPQVLEQKARLLEESTGIFFEGKQVKDSVANICSYMSRLLVNANSDSRLLNTYNKNYWVNKYEKVGGTKNE